MYKALNRLHWIPGEGNPLNSCANGRGGPGRLVVTPGSFPLNNTLSALNMDEHQGDTCHE